jgi:hypothetical protein
VAPEVLIQCLNRYLVLAVGVILCAAAHVCFAADEKQNAVAALFADWNKPTTPGCSVGVLRDAVFFSGARLEWQTLSTVYRLTQQLFSASPPFRNNSPVLLSLYSLSRER